MASKRAAGSPCVDVCMIDNITGLCMGCFRSAEEISLWDRFTRGQRARVMAKISKRRGTLGAKIRPKGRARDNAASLYKY